MPDWLKAMCVLVGVYVFGFYFGWHGGYDEGVRAGKEAVISFLQSRSSESK